jgi:uncharacterized membrane protein HdeD (DUF308 family)
VILVLLGLAAIFLPLRLGVALLWWLFMIGGAAGLATTMVMRSAPGFWWSLLSALLALAIAILLLAVPELAIVGLPLLLMTFLVVEGIATIMLALDHWRALSGRWAWMLASGIVDLWLAGFIVIGLPWTATWALGLILAVNLIFGGGAMVAMALAARNQAARAQRREAAWVGSRADADYLAGGLK